MVYRAAENSLSDSRPLLKSNSGGTGGGEKRAEMRRRPFRAGGIAGGVNRGEPTTQSRQPARQGKEEEGGEGLVTHPRARRHQSWLRRRPQF